MESGTLGAIYLPALRAKDIALEIQLRQGDAAGIRQDAVETSVKQIVLGAYQLDSYGDLGDGEKVKEAYRSFSEAISRLDSLVSSQP